MDYDVQSAASGVATSAINDLGDVANLNKTEARAALLHFFGHDNCVTRAEAEAARLREALASLVRAVERLDERPFASEASVLIDAYRHARAALDSEDGGE